MKNFNNFQKFSEHLKKVVAQHAVKEFKALSFIGKFLSTEAKYRIGHLQIGGGKFQSWPDLAESTKIDKLRLGFVFNSEYNPLYRTGELKDSIGYVVNKAKKAVYIGSPSDIALYQEMGTDHIPARSFLGLTMYKEKHQIEFMLQQFLINWMSGKNSVFKRR
jgi:hypothetical protein